MLVVVAAVMVVVVAGRSCDGVGVGVGGGSIGVGGDCDGVGVGGVFGSGGGGGGGFGGVASGRSWWRWWLVLEVEAVLWLVLVVVLVALVVGEGVNPMAFKTVLQMGGRKPHIRKNKTPKATNSEKKTRAQEPTETEYRKTDSEKKTPRFFAVKGVLAIRSADRRGGDGAILPPRG